jgi:hypothetical protein
MYIHIVNIFYLEKCIKIATRQKMEHKENKIIGILNKLIECIFNQY